MTSMIGRWNNTRDKIEGINFCSQKLGPQPVGLIPSILSLVLFHRPIILVIDGSENACIWPTVPLHYQTLF